MQYLTLDELPETLDPARALLHLSGFGGVVDRARLERWRRRSGSLAEYGGVFAVEGDVVVGQTLVNRIPYTFPEGRETVAGIAAVATRPDHRRLGVAQRVLEEVHRREREAGTRFAFLWTNRSWGAHRLYERLGYSDVYFPGWAVRLPRRAERNDRAVRLRPPRRTELGALERLHDAVSRGRWGFATRARGHLRYSAEWGEIEPRESLVVVVRRGRLEGYAYVEPGVGQVVCGELLARDVAAAAELARAVERKARGKAVVFRHEPAQALEGWLKERGYLFLDDGWYGMLALSLERRLGRRELLHRTRASDPRFVCHSSDRF